jgi:D-galactarolactone isomerase
MAKLAPNVRGVAVVDTSVSDAELKRLHEFGVRGIRFNLVQAGATTVEMLEPLSKRANELGWHIQIHMLGDGIVKIEDVLARSPIVFDHMGRIPKDVGTDHAAYGVIRKLIDRGRTWVKISGPYMDTKVGPIPANLRRRM